MGVVQIRAKIDNYMMHILLCCLRKDWTNLIASDIVLIIIIIIIMKLTL